MGVSRERPSAQLNEKELATKRGEGGAWSGNASPDLPNTDQGRKEGIDMLIDAAERIDEGAKEEGEKRNLAQIPRRRGIKGAGRRLNCIIGDRLPQSPDFFYRST